MRDRERHSMSRGGTEREGENTKQALCYQCRAWCRAWTHEPWDQELSWNQESDGQSTEPPRWPVTNFPDDEGCWASFHVSVGHLDVFIGEMSVHVFCPFLIELFGVFWCWVIEVLYIFWILILYHICHSKISSPIQ